MYVGPFVFLLIDSKTIEPFSIKFLSVDTLMLS